jgi:DNA polymerase-4
VRTVRILRDIPPLLLDREFGKMGRILPPERQRHRSSPGHPLQRNKIDVKANAPSARIHWICFIRSMLGAMADELAFELRQDNRLTSCITVKIRYADFNTSYQTTPHLLIRRRPAR